VQTAKAYNGSHSQRDIVELLGPWQTPGYLMIIGGADRLDSEARLPRLFLRLVERTEQNTTQSGVVLISTATRHPEILTSEYYRIFTRIGLPVEKIYAPFVRSRDEAQDPEVGRLISRAAGVFITGGDQYTLSQTLDHTPIEEAIMDAYGRGATIAGTSAGATVMGRPMIVAGGGSGELRVGMVQMSNGLAWAGDDLIIDTHFGARGRFPRLTSAVAEHPDALGVGIDENTCLLVEHTGHTVVAGTGVVYLVDGSHLVLNTARDAHPGQAISAGALRVTVLSAGAQYNLRTRELMIAPEGSRRV
jgi:cyanophycinase